MTSESPLEPIEETKHRHIPSPTQRKSPISLIDSEHKVNISFAMDVDSLKLEEKPFSSGTYAFIYKGILEDEVVAVKQLK